MKHLVFVVLFLISSQLLAQAVKEGTTYTVSQLSQEPVASIKEIYPESSKEVGDTTYTLYSGSSVDFRTYFVNGDQYDNIFNPNPTGIYVNGRYFMYYCDIERTMRQNFNDILEGKEFSYLGKTYLMLINYREDCLGDGCRYRCYNVFDITDPKKITQESFSSIFTGTDTFGEFNADGNIDFLRIAPKPPKDVKKGEIVDHYLVTAFTIKNGKATQLSNSTGHAYYLYVKGDEEVSQFQILQADWFFSVKDTSGAVAKPTSYFAEYISFDPLYRHLYNPEGIRIEKNRWSVLVGDVGDLEAAQDQCRRIQGLDFEDVYIMVDQYSRDIKYQIFVGNFINKEGAVKHLSTLQKNAIKGQLTDFRSSY